MNARLQPVATPVGAGSPWALDSIVTELRAARLRSLADRQRNADQPPRLPSRKALVGIVDGLSAALFPHRLGPPELADDGIDYFVGHTLDVTLRQLHSQLYRELRYLSEQQGGSGRAAERQRAADIIGAFAARLPDIRAVLDSDIRAAYEGDPAAGSLDEVLVCYPGITAIIHHRLAHALHRLGAPLIARIIAEIAHSATGIDIHPGAEIGGSFFIDHGTGVVIGETTIIGQRVRLYQAVTLGAKRFPAHENGSLIKGNARHPIVEDDVVIYAGATILGRITIGHGSTIGGNVWLTRSVPPGSNISQAQVRSEAFDGGAGI
ncbi:MAG TPA: serine acetyltransferase [Candidatus Competibacteraceae bacterium]|nr:MAG: serine acetyltransferase [Candidatus Competibacteraceae bacterium]HOB63419.1 serine acetyltransferase [Candidatus Competibacteraceae bacterium]HQA26875.1 serine acetyltransferase [Candidatus Competibacteraceae bacterium]HQD57920.1 serine acetyltransferase [Candidatus Competibacteraceae bacterium]